MAAPPRTKRHVAIDGEKMTKARIDAEYSMRDIAEKLGCNKGTISRWEQGVLNPSLKRVKKLIEIYGRNDFVVEGEGK